MNMPPRSSQTSPSSKKSSKQPQKRTTAKLGSVNDSNVKRINPLTAFVSLPSSQDESRRSSSSSQSKPSSKEKGKAKEVVKESRIRRHQDDESQDTNDQLWVDLYEPTTEGELAVHVRKVEEVRRWLDEAFNGGPSGKLRKYRRILALTGLAGTAKTSTIRVLSRELKFDTLEWRNTMGETTNVFGDFNEYASSDESLITKFQLFLERATRCRDIFDTSTPSTSQTRTQSTPTRRIILLEDLPNILHLGTRARFQETIQSLLSTEDTCPVPIVIIVSDSGTRGEASDERLANGVWGRDYDGVIDIRTVLPKEILNGPYVTHIRFNPIAPTLLRKALQALLNKHFSSRKSPISTSALDIVVESANGDIRSAIMALQFACIRLSSSSSSSSGDTGRGAKGRKKKSSDEAQVLVESITRREQSLVLFHLMGKVLYNKRKGDPPNPSATAKDIKRDQEIDMALKDPPKLPPYLHEHERKASRVNVDAIYADSPIDSSLFSLYIHQNYPQFCEDVDQCDGIAEWLSYADSSGGEAWYQANPYRFHLLTLGTLHSLPSPVARKSQKFYKPEFFEKLAEERRGWEGVRDVKSWIDGLGIDGVGGVGWNPSTWTHRDIITDLGGVFRAWESQSQSQFPTTTQTRTRTRAYPHPHLPLPPKSHRSFTRLNFTFDFSRSSTSGGSNLLSDHEDGVVDGYYGEGEGEGGGSEGDGGRGGTWDWERSGRDIGLEIEPDKGHGGWLDSDDIEEF